MNSWSPLLPISAIFGRLKNKKSTINKAELGNKLIFILDTSATAAKSGTLT